ncbi:unnamed protein product [Enterobius vermicularis]|uniref:NAD(P)-binding protein n=1 Tax=Enterobius vermicularis TaxID=51028 RepID=A0A0N4V334_ENTVE|nr:unnamed protein product [Enterobius vermicularis]
MVLVPSSILITGANRGIGLGLLKQWAKYPEVKHIFACVRKPSEGSELGELAKADARIHCIQLDVNADKSISDAVRKVKTTLGDDVGLNLLINNAGIMIADGSKLEGADRSMYLQHFDTNVVSVAKVVEAFYALLKLASENSVSKEWGVHRAAIINISSALGSISLNNGGTKYVKNIPYGLSKTALNQLTKTLAVDFTPNAILVVSMDPGWCRTDMGGSGATYSVEESTKKQVETALTLRQEHSGSFIKNTGEILPY